MSQAKEIQLLSQDGKLLKSYSAQQDFIDLNESYQKLVRKKRAA